MAAFTLYRSGNGDRWGKQARAGANCEGATEILKSCPGVRKTALPAPEGLSERSRRCWEAETRRRTKSAGRLLLLEQALRRLDRADELRALVDKDGLTTT